MPRARTRRRSRDRRPSARARARRVDGSVAPAPAFEVHDPRVYERVLRNGSVGLGRVVRRRMVGHRQSRRLPAARAARSATAPRSTGSAAPRAAARSSTRSRACAAPIRRATSGTCARTTTSATSSSGEYSTTRWRTRARSSTHPTTTLADASRAKFDRIARMAAARARRPTPRDRHRLGRLRTPRGRALRLSGHDDDDLDAPVRVRARTRAAAPVSATGSPFSTPTTGTCAARSTRSSSIEMIEAVDWREYDTFFEHVRALLTDDGTLTMQAIVVPDESFDRLKRHTDFIKAAIFPGGCLPSVGALTAAANRSGDLSAARPRRHRPPLRRDPAALARQPRRHRARAPGPRSRRPLRPVVALLLRVLRSRLRRALHQRGAVVVRGVRHGPRVARRCATRATTPTTARV